MRDQKNRERPFISVLVPIRNEEDHIAGCLRALVGQSYPAQRYEVIVLDGMSDDQTRRIVQDFCEYHPHLIQMVDNPQKIVPVALNIGLRVARGEVILRVDGHAEIAPDYLEKCVRHLREPGVACVGGYIESVNETYLGKAIALAMSSPFGVGNARFRTSGRPGLVDTLAFGAYRREVFQTVGEFDEELVRCQDDEFNYRLRKTGGKIFFTPEIRSTYYPRASLKKLWRQYFGYGFWKIRVLQKHLPMMQPRQFVPPLFVAALLFSLLLGGMGVPLGGVVLAAVAGSYALANLGASCYLAAQKGGRYLPALPLIFAILHISYGSGFLLGLIRFAPRWLPRRRDPREVSAEQV